MKSKKSQLHQSTATPSQTPAVDQSGCSVGTGRDASHANLDGALAAASRSVVVPMASLLQRHHSPPLLPIDVFGMSALLLRYQIDEHLMRPGKPLDSKVLLFSERLALLQTLAALPVLAHDAGLAPKFWIHATTYPQLVLDRWLEWRSLLNEVSAKKRSNSYMPIGDPRREALYAVWSILAQRTVVSEEALLGDLRRAFTSAFRRRPEPGEETPASLAASVVLAAGGPDIPFEWIEFGRDRKLHVTWSRVRDGIRIHGRKDSRWRRRRRALPPYQQSGDNTEADAQSPQSLRAQTADMALHACEFTGADAAETKRIVDVHAAADTCGDGDPSELAATNEERLQTLEFVRRAQQAIEARRSQARPGSSNAAVLGEFEAIVQGDVSLSSVAASHGFSKSTVHEAWSRELAFVRRAVSSQ